MMMPKALPRRAAQAASLNFLSTLLILFGLTLCFCRSAEAQTPAGAYEKFGMRQARDVVPPTLLQSTQFRLAPTVRTFGYLNDFVVSSDYGTFEAKSDTMLRRLDREIGAIAALRRISLTDAYIKALGQAATGPLRGVEALVSQPVETVAALPTAVFNIFSRPAQSVETTLSGQKTEYEDSAMASLVQMSSYKRDYATSLGVDPYSSNSVLQKDLGDIAWAAAAGGLTVSGATMMGGSAVVSGLSKARNIDQAMSIVASEPPPELMIRNRGALDKMGVSPELSKRFLDQKQYSPRAKTILIASLAGMTMAKGKEALLEAALIAPDEVTAIVYQQTAELLNGYDERVARIVQLQRRNRLVIARDANGKSVILAPLDYVIWDEVAATAARSIAKSLGLKPGGGSFELWLTGTASPRFKTEARALGISVREGVAAKLPLVD